MEIEFFSASLINLAINLGYSVIAIIVSVYALFWVDKKLLKGIDIEAEIKGGNVAAAIFASAILIFVAIVMAFGFKG
ncbi:DUF350 domain-containing protein [Ferrimonas aestuarii]|uniref:DUF350 domain-containing protein n=1 Tax=Ferrimonas aestuarii TaxID=2569539 RepID=A0A4U1BLE1_9GAMM|nr:DUF350 domain-containing protein [Ferrimonas aestuarii]TKB53348.1 DUF350 domain-containing protein [Ferrimonas aestuarii]